MKVIDYKFTDELRKYIENSEKNMRYYAENRMYDCANTCEQNMSWLQNMLNTILARFVTEIPDGDTSEGGGYVEIDETNFETYYGKVVEFSNDKDFTTIYRGKLYGYVPNSVDFQYLTEDAITVRYKYARVKRESKR